MHEYLYMYLYIYSKIDAENSPAAEQVLRARVTHFSLPLYSTPSLSFRVGAFSLYLSDLLWRFRLLPSDLDHLM